MRRHFTISFSLLCMMFASTMATPVRAQAPERSLEGVWVVKVTPRNCETGESLPDLAFESLLTFHQGGTASMSIKGNTNIAALVRTPFHGLWRREHGWNTYKYKVVHIRSSAATMEFRGLQESGALVTLSESGDEFTADGYTIVYSTDGVPGTPGCSTSAGVRFLLTK
jgi:hypothetical protein